MVWLSDGGKNFVDMFSHFDRIPVCDGQTGRRTDRRRDTDRQTSSHGIVRAIHTRRAVKKQNSWLSKSEISLRICVAVSNTRT